MFVALAVRHPKGAREEALMMEEMRRFAEVESKHKGFVQLVVGEVKDERIIIPFTIWETKEDAMAAQGDIVRFLIGFDFKAVQEGPTRSGSVTISAFSSLSSFKVVPVSPHSSSQIVWRATITCFIPNFVRAVQEILVSALFGAAERRLIYNTAKGVQRPEWNSESMQYRRRRRWRLQ